MVAVRETCSNGSKPSADNSGAWSMVRQRGTVSKMGKTEINARYGPLRQMDKCMGDKTFASEHASWSGKTKDVTEGAIKLTEGIACSEDSEVQRKIQASTIEVRGKLPENYAEWPRNARIIDGTFKDGSELEHVLKGIKYNHK